MAAFVVNGRRYPMPGKFTLKELSDIKKVSGIEAQRIEEALANGDPDAAMGVLWVVMRRADPTVTLETIEALEAVEIKFEADEEADAGPPDPGETPSEPPSANEPSTTTSNGDGEASPETTPATSGAP